jgi:hypothetical protein
MTLTEMRRRYDSGQVDSAIDLWGIEVGLLSSIKPAYLAYFAISINLDVVNLGVIPHQS